MVAVGHVKDPESIWIFMASLSHYLQGFTYIPGGDCSRISGCHQLRVASPRRANPEQESDSSGWTALDLLLARDAKRKDSSG